MMFVVEFGSKKRGDHDCTSDRDVLLLGDRGMEMEEHKARFTAEECNVSCFSITCARYLLSHGSLFFKHVIDEGSLIAGAVHEFERLTSAWKRARSYDCEIQSTVDLLELLSFTPLCSRGLTIGVDILVNCLRSILIRKLAKEGLYIFSWRGVLAHSSNLGFLPRDAERVVLYARMIKNQYRRSGQMTGELRLLESLAEIVRVTTGDGDRVPRIQFSSRRNNGRLPERLPDHSYKQLRALEFLCAQYPSDPSLAPLERFFKEPNSFCSAKHQNAEVLNFVY